MYAVRLARILLIDSQLIITDQKGPNMKLTLILSTSDVYVIRRALVDQIYRCRQCAKTSTGLDEKNAFEAHADAAYATYERFRDAHIKADPPYPVNED